MKRRIRTVFIMSLAFSFILVLGGCRRGSDPSDQDPDPDDDPIVDTGPFEVKVSLPSIDLLDVAEQLTVIEDAPDLLILGVVLDTYHFFHYETMSGFEYVKVFNNTESDYNMKNHRIVTADPLAGQNYGSELIRSGDKGIASSYLFNGLIDEDFIIPSLSIGLIWLKPYYWTAGAGTGAFNKIFSAAVIHRDGDQQGAMSQSISDFESFWDMEDNEVPVYELTNMGLISKRPIGGTDELYPIISPGAGTPYTHLNATLLRTLEIQKFNDNEGTASIELLNKYSELSLEKQQNPDPVYGKIVFNTMEIKHHDVVQDIYDDYSNSWNFFDPIVRATWSGLIQVSSMTPGQTEVDFSVTGQPGTTGWQSTVELIFRPPTPGSIHMQWQLPLRELAKFKSYLPTMQANVMHFAEEDVIAYRFVEKTILVRKNPDTDDIHLRADELRSDGRMSGAAPTQIKAITLTRPQAAN